MAAPTTSACAPTAPSAPVSDDFPTLRERLALRGHSLRRLPDGAGYLVAAWNHSRTFDSIDEVRDFARQVGAAA